MQKIIYIILIILGICNNVISKGTSGYYVLNGIAYQHKSMPLRNKILQLEYGNKKVTIKTNSNGEYSVKIFWELPCMFEAKNQLDEQLIDLSFNPKYLMFKYKELCVYVENFYYHLTFNNTKNQSFWTDLYF